MFKLSREEDNVAGRLTMQFFRWIKDISAVVAELLRLLGSGAILASSNRIANVWGRVVKLQSCIVYISNSCCDNDLRLPTSLLLPMNLGSERGRITGCGWCSFPCGGA